MSVTNSLKKYFLAKTFLLEFPIGHPYPNSSDICEAIEKEALAQKKVLVFVNQKKTVDQLIQFTLDGELYEVDSDYSEGRMGYVIGCSKVLK